jgi:hypothetical protein
MAYGNTIPEPKWIMLVQELSESNAALIDMAPVMRAFILAEMTPGIFECVEALYRYPIFHLVWMGLKC